MFAVIALVVAFGIVRLIGAPGYTDVYYHMNAATRMASGQGLTDAYVWTYIGALDHLPMPSHLYWMPLTSVIAGLSMSLFNAPGDYTVAQLPFVLMFAATACIGYWLGWRLGGTSRHAWVAGLVTLFSGFYTKFWGEIDTFAPYALVGSLCLVVMGMGARRLTPPPTPPRLQGGEKERAHSRAPLQNSAPREERARHASPLRRTMFVWGIVGALAALGHLTRADGVLLLIVGAMVVGWMGIWKGQTHRFAPTEDQERAHDGAPLQDGEPREERARHASPLREAGEGETRAQHAVPRQEDESPEERTTHVSPLQETSGGEARAHRRAPLQQVVVALAALAIGYVLVMLPYFARNWQAIGSPLPLGGTQAIWFSEYNDIFNYPPNSSPATLLANGLGTLISSRREAVVNNIGTFVAVEGLIVMTPLMLIGLWRRRREPFLLPFALYAVGVHLAMTFVFPFPGYRGGLLHSAAALIPFWAALGVVGLDDVIAWVAKRRRRWNARTAKMVFSGGLVALAVGLSWFIGMAGRVSPIGDTSGYDELPAALPADARILSDDPPQLYYYTGMGGASLPNGTPETLLEVARQYDIDYVVIMGGADSIPAGLQSILDNPPAFLKLIPGSGMRVYAIQR
ncbi:MAG: hypothetical protein GC204_14170 [Chloroflexi bacterium]|nr:hypothetical protein [Chloroflexota bacterium]